MVPSSLAGHHGAEPRAGGRGGVNESPEPPAYSSNLHKKSGGVMAGAAGTWGNLKTIATKVKKVVTTGTLRFGRRRPSSVVGYFQSTFITS
jgi:hypothetical protein